MEFFFLVFLIVLSTILQIVILRMYLSQLLTKLTGTQSIHTPVQTQIPTIDTLKKFQFQDSPSPNTVSEEETNEMEFSEQVPFEIPKDIKFEVEGGDTQVPPEFAAK